MYVKKKGKLHQKAHKEARKKGVKHLLKRQAHEVEEVS
jgi:hypothetical protein